MIHESLIIHNVYTVIGREIRELGILIDSVTFRSHTCASTGLVVLPTSEADIQLVIKEQISFGKHAIIFDEGSKLVTLGGCSTFRRQATSLARRAKQVSTKT